MSHQRLTEMGVVPEMSFLSWFMCLFINTLPIKSALCVWDCLLVEKKDVLLRVGLAVLKLCERVLCVADNPFDLNQTLQAAPKRIDDAEKLMQTAFNAGVQQEEIDQLRKKHTDEILLEERRINELRQERTDEQKLKEYFVPGHGGDEKVILNGGGAVVQLNNGELLRATVFVSSFRLIVVPRSSSVTSGIISMPLLAIQTPLEPEEGGVRAGNGTVFNAPSLKVVSKAAQSLLFIFDPDLMDLLKVLEETSGGGDDGEDEEAAAAAAAAAAELRKKVRTKPPRTAEKTDMDKNLETFLQGIQQQIETSSVASEAPFMRKADAEFSEAGLGVYDAKKEFERQGALSESSGWRQTTLNDDYGLCSTYPSVLLIPSKVTDEQLAEVVKFRSKQRLPALSWFDSNSQAAIVRCAQPLVGALGKKSIADEEYFDEIIKANTQNRGIAMLDARPKVNAIANKGKGGGYENIDRYDAGSATLIFLDIDNIHVMRNSIAEMHSLVASEDRTEAIRRTDYQLGWLVVHTGRVLGGAATIVREVGDKKRTALVHCSDGWDRTAQLCALAEMCLDPYYRTVEGFQIVCQREWLSFGHKFLDRIWGHKLKERSPVFLQFLDCVHQLIEEYPTAFEFNQAMLLFILDSMYSLEFVEFRYNCEGLRTTAMQSDAPPGPTSMWQVCRGEEFRNQAFEPVSEFLRPPVRARVWTQYFNRWVVDPIAGQLPAPAAESETAATEQSRVLTWTMEKVTSDEPGSVTPAQQMMFHESKPVKEGWITHNVRTRVGYTTKLRWLALHPSVNGEAYLVFSEKQSSESIVPVEVIPLADGDFQVRLMPLRSKSIDKHCFQVRHKASQSTAGSDAEASIIVKARSKETLELTLREGEQARWQASVSKLDVKIAVSFVPTDPAVQSEIVEAAQVIGDPNEPKRGGFIGGVFRAPSMGVLRLELDNSYSKMTKKEIDYVLEGSIEVIEEVIEQLTRDSDEKIEKTERDKLVGSLAVNMAGRERSKTMAALLAQRVGVQSIPVKLQALKLIEELVRTGSDHFKAETAKSVLSQHIKALRSFDKAHPDHGDKPAEMIRKSSDVVAGLLQAQLEIATPRGREAQVPFVKENLYVEAGEEKDAWIEAIQDVSGQTNPLDASDDEEEDDTGLNKLTQRLSTAATIDGGDGGLPPPESGEIDIQVKARKEQEVAFELKAGENLKWELKLEKYDVRCRASFKYNSPPEGVMGDKVPLFKGGVIVTGDPKNPDAGGKSTMEYTADKGDGTLTVILDNSYSKMRAKRVRLSVALATADGQPIGCNIIHSGGSRFVAEREG